MGGGKRAVKNHFFGTFLLKKAAIKLERRGGGQLKKKLRLPLFAHPQTILNYLSAHHFNQQLKPKKTGNYNGRGVL